MKHITREELILEFCRFTADKMDEETLKNIAVVTLIANIKGENEEGSTYEDWEDAVAQMKSKTNTEDLLELIKPFMMLRIPTDEG